MPGQLGGLVVSLGLNSVDFSTGLTKAERDARKFAESFSNNVAVGIVKAEVALRALGAAAQFAIHAIPDLIEQAGHFQDLAEKTGASAEGLASLGVAAKVTSTSMDDVANFSIKVSKNLSKMGEDSNITASALTALGIPIKEFKALNPDEQFDRLAKALGKFSDIGGGKAAALEAIAKGGAQLLPFLKELEDGTGRVNILTKEQIQRADEFSDATKRSSAILNTYAQALAIEFAPAITAFKDAITDTIKEMLGLNDQSRKLPTEAVRNFADQSAIALAGVVDVVRGLIAVYRVLDEVAKRSAITARLTGEERKPLSTLGADVNSILMEETAVERVRKNIAAQRAAETRAQTGPPAPAGGGRPQLKFDFDAGAANRAAAEAKKTLDQQLKALDSFIGSERETLGQRESFLRSYYQDDQIGLRDFFQGRRNALDDAVKNELAAFDKQADLLRQFAARAKPEARIDAETKLADVLAKRAKLQQDAAFAGINLSLEEERAVRALTDSVERASIALQEMQGNSVGAAGAAFDLAHRKILSDLNLLAKSTNPQDQALAGQGQAIIEQTRQLTLARAELAKTTSSYNLTLDELGIAQQRIDIAQSTGDLTTLGALRAKSELAAKYTDILREQIAVLEAQAQLTGRPEDIVRVKQLQVQLEALAATGDLVAKEFNKIFVDNFATAIEQAVSGTKSLKDAFLDMAKSIEQAITRIAAQNIAEAIFGKTGGGGLDFGSILSKLFAGLAGAGGGSFGGAGGGGGFGTLAVGTDNWRGGPTWVGETGPEIVNLPKGASVTPAKEAAKMFGPRMNFVINVLPGANTKTANQAAMQTGIAVQRALAKNG